MDKRKKTLDWGCEHHLECVGITNLFVSQQRDAFCVSFCVSLDLAFSALPASMWLLLLPAQCEAMLIFSFSSSFFGLSTDLLSFLFLVHACSLLLSSFFLFFSLLLESTLASRTLLYSQLATATAPHAIAYSHSFIHSFAPSLLSLISSWTTLPPPMTAPPLPPNHNSPPPSF